MHILDIMRRWIGYGIGAGLAIDDNGNGGDDLNKGGNDLNKGGGPPPPPPSHLQPPSGPMKTPVAPAVDLAAPPAPGARRANGLVTAQALASAVALHSQPSRRRAFAARLVEEKPANAVVGMCAALTGVAAPTTPPREVAPAPAAKASSAAAAAAARSL